MTSDSSLSTSQHLKGVFIIDSSTITWIWLIAGGVLAVSEVFVPGGVVFFLGAGAAGVAGLRALGVVETWPASIAAWMGLSLTSIVALRGLLHRFTSSEKSFQPTDEDLDAYGAVVEVSSDVDDVGEKGRIRFRGTTWAARTLHGCLPPGSSARILHRDNLVWVVEAAEPGSLVASRSKEPSAK